MQSRGEEPTHSSLSYDGRYLFVANYAVNPDPGGALTVVPVGKDGTLSEAVQVLPLGPGSKVNSERQMSSHVHLAVPTPENKYVVSADLGADKLFVYTTRARPNHCSQPRCRSCSCQAARGHAIPSSVLMVNMPGWCWK